MQRGGLTNYALSSYASAQIKMYDHGVLMCSITVQFSFETVFMPWGEKYCYHIEATSRSK